MDTTGFINASAATGQPFFAPHMPAQFMPHATPPGMNLIPHGNLRHPGMQHFLLQQHPPQPMMVPVGQMTPGHYPDNTIYYGMCSTAGAGCIKLLITFLYNRPLVVSNTAKTRKLQQLFIL